LYCWIYLTAPSNPTGLSQGRPKPSKGSKQGKGGKTIKAPKQKK